MKTLIAHIFLSIIAPNCASQVIEKRVQLLMGTRFEITVVARDSTAAATHIDTAIAEISRIEKLISSWDEASETSKINRNAGIEPVRVSEELFQLIQRSIAISNLTDGAFDISYASMDKIWKFDGTMKSIPSEATIKNSVANVGYKNIELNPENRTVFLKKEGTQLGFGAIGKGYAADKAKELLQKQGVVAGIINASGDMNTWGKQPNGEQWKVAITNPMDKNKAYGLLPVKGAVATSGNYEKYVTFNNTRYAHIIDPRTGYPTTGFLSVTVFAPKAELADALATSVFVMGSKTGIDRINQLPNIECIIVLEDGSLKTSKNIKLETAQ